MLTKMKKILPILLLISGFGFAQQSGTLLNPKAINGYTVNGKILMTATDGTTTGVPTWTNTIPFSMITGTPTIPSTTTLVPYTGATSDVDLDTHSLNAKSLHVKGTGGDGHLGLKHQSANITANASESSLGANASGKPVWKNDGNAIQELATTDMSITINGVTKTFTSTPTFTVNAVQSLTGNNVDNTDPLNPIINQALISNDGNSDMSVSDGGAGINVTDNTNAINVNILPNAFTVNSIGTGTINFTGSAVQKNGLEIATTNQLPVLTASTNITVSGASPNYTISASSSSLTIVVTPEMFGAVGDGTTNDQTALQSAVNYNSGNVEVKLTYGKNYYTATTFTTGDNVKITGNGRASVISTTANISILTIKGKNNVIDGVTFRGNSTGSNQRGIDLTGVSTFTLYYLNNQVNNSYFENFGGAGIYATNIIGSSSGSLHEGAISCNNVVITGCNYGVNFATRAEYNLLNNMSISSCTVGVSFTGGNNYISNSKITDNSTALEVLTGTNDGHSGASNCALNHNTINFKATHTLGFSLDNCFLYAGAVTHTGTGKTKYNNCWFSMSTFNFTQTNSPVEMNNCEMVVLPNNFSLTGQKPVLNGCSSGTLTLCYPDRTFAPSYTLAANGTFTVPYSWGIESITIRNTTANAITGGLRIGTTNGGAEVVTAQAVGANEQVQILPQDIKKYFFAYNATTTLYVQAVTAWNSANIIMIVKLKQWNNF